MIAREKIEQAEIDLDVAVGRLNAAQRQDAFARPRQAQIVIVQPGELQREIRLDRRAEIGGPLRINIEPAIGQLARENGLRGFVDQRSRGRIPDAIHRRMQPELQQNVVGLERGVGGELRPPITLLGLDAGEILGGAPRGLRSPFHQSACDLQLRAHTRAIVVSLSADRSKSAGRWKRTSSSFSSISSM